jgi:hypothetical protein
MENSFVKSTTYIHDFRESWGLKLKIIEGYNWIEKVSAGRSAEKYLSYLVHNLTIFEHFLSFNDQNL